MTGIRPERVNGHIGTEIRPRLLREAAANYVPAAAVTRKVRALFGIIGRKGHAGGFASLV